MSNSQSLQDERSVDLFGNTIVSAASESPRSDDESSEKRGSYATEDRLPLFENFDEEPDN